MRPPDGDCETCHAICRSTVSLDCIQRGEQTGKLKCDCSGRVGGSERWIETYRCNSPDQPRRSCIIAGQIRMEPEASLYAVCAGCRWREGPETELSVVRIADT